MLPEPFHADYSFFEKFCGLDGAGEKGAAIKLLLKDIEFSAKVQNGLEFADVVTNALRRSLAGHLGREGWQNIHRLMIHENGEPYISFVLFQEGPDIIHHPAYKDVVNDGFREGGRLMLTKRNARLALDIQAGKPLIAV